MLTTKDLGALTVFGRRWTEYDITSRKQDYQKMARSGLMTMPTGRQWPLLWLFTSPSARNRKHAELLKKHPDWEFQPMGLKQPMQILTREQPPANVSLNDITRSAAAGRQF